MSHYHDRGLVVLSVLIAIVASYAALALAGRVAAAKGPQRALWLGGGAIAMGVGIWSMHYIGMLAFHLPVRVLYDIPTVLLSLLAATFASAVALWIVGRRNMSLAQAASGSVLMGIAIAVMHYTGMAAMRLPATATYDTALVALSVGIAIVVAFVALCLAFNLRGGQGAGFVWRKIGSAIVMGAAIPSMHYTGMAAVHFHPVSGMTAVLSGADIPALGATAIALASFVVLGLAILTSFASRRFDVHAEALASSEGARQAQEQFFREVLDASPQLIFARDSEGRYALANRAFAEWAGYPAEQLVGSLDLTFQPPSEELTGSVREDCEVIESGHSRMTTDLEAVSPASGERRWFDVAKVRLSSATQAGALSLGIATDMTHRRRLEEQLRQAQKMEAVGLLAGGVAHDFNNMLTAIIGHADLLLEDAPADGPKDDLLEIRRAAERAARLTHQLLAFSRRQVLQPAVFDLNVLLGETLTMLRRLIGEDIELRSIAGVGHAAIKADPGQLEQVVLNLVVNARDAMPKGGKLTLETSLQVIEEGDAQNSLPAGPGRYVVLSVSDTGVGMSAAVKAHLFEPFFTTKAPGLGTGLGLATVYGIVKQSDGHIGVYSEPGLGTSFKLYFPQAAGPIVPRVHESPTSSTERRGSETILVVEDEDVVRLVTCTMLGKRGYRILVASAGPEALELAASHDGPIHLLLTDLVMPQMSGRDLGERLHLVRPETRVLYVSGYTSDTAVLHGVLEADVPFLQKPFTSDSLARCVREVLDAPMPSQVA